MRYTPHLNIIITVLEKIRHSLTRDFNEIKNLQRNYSTILKFSKFAYDKAKKDIIFHLERSRSDINIEIIGEENQFINKNHPTLTYVVNPIDGLINFSRAIPCFTSAISLKEKIDGKEEIINCALLNSATADLFLAEKGRGAFLNNNRIRISGQKDDIYAISAYCDIFLANESKTKNHYFSNCFNLDMAYLASGKIDYCLAMNKNKKYLQSSILLVKEAGAMIEEKNDFIIFK